ncbi:hypothetical protein SDC9_133776 [bioreactor metagenome]|uniref:Uncharacterized protein n=1 Tax=bioreactor metagenome TaxID=1076179 RepID=A0A645DBX0_9ZZZZ
MQVQADQLFWVALADCTHGFPDGDGSGPAHGVQQANTLGVQTVFFGDAEACIDQGEHSLQRDVAVEVASECRSHVHVVHGDVAGGKVGGNAAGFCLIVLEAGVLVFLQEGGRSGQRDGAGDVEHTRALGAIQAFFIEPDTCVLYAGSAGDALADLIGVGHLWNHFGVHKRAHHDLLEACLRQGIDQSNLVICADQTFFNLKAFARAFFFDRNSFGKVEHGSYSLRDRYE